MQTQAYRTIVHCLKDAISKERGGLRGLYTGYAATMIRDLPYFALQLGFYGASLHSRSDHLILFAIISHTLVILMPRYISITLTKIKSWHTTSLVQ